jgi:hypothetical protein
VASAEKSIQKMRNNPRDWRIEELQAIARRLGIDYCRAPNGKSTPVPAARSVKPVYVRNFLALVDSLEGSNDE